MTIPRSVRLGCALVLLGLAGCAPPPEREAAPEEVAAGDTTALAPLADEAAGTMLYVPAYSHIFYQDGTRDIGLAATLSVRNTDPERPITITGVRYYDSDGQLVRPYVAEPITLGPLSSRAFVVEERDRTGGVGANFIVTWQASEPVSPPLVESVMISTESSQGISFVSRGRPIERPGIVVPPPPDPPSGE